MARDFVLLGKITKPHGIRGEVRMYPYSGQPENILNYRTIFIETGQGAARESYEIRQARVQGNVVLLKLEGCEDRNQAEALVNREVWLDYRDLPELEEDEYYWADLHGKIVRTEDGRELGRVTGLLETGAHTVLSVTGTGQEYLIPVRDEFIVRIDDHEMILDLPSGLLEMNRS